ncbi:MAG: bifunctional phosphoribosylaminoimidazolecarboxamide formyltransferase/IMP cyclohydrolase [Treponema sp.]|jgi:phosphoribosylaminoimidazolecarboxamide formyltransferase/IMP cyclohydrolase|nr:bifunctional phosphoribosylaminoimidazolecarboxamide formyltransferase/IMP cyclohydrolase [Treponema sp.]
MGKRALLSVYNKDGILDLAGFLTGAGWEIISTGGTFKYLQDNSIPVTDISQVTGFPECLDGRVKTLHPAIFAGILASSDNNAHIDTLKSQKIEKFDLVCVNLYPFFEKVRAGLSDEETIEFIDIGGPSMLRSAAKNYRDVIVLTDPADYAQTIDALKNGDVPENYRRKLAGKVFNLTSAYDAAVARYMGDEEYPRYLPLSFEKDMELRYGENSHQSASLYLSTDKPGVFTDFEQLNGKEMGYNNIRDLDIAWKAVCAFGTSAGETPPWGHSDVSRILPEVNDNVKVCCVAIKHNAPCGISLADNLLEAYDKTYLCDPVSIFGGIIACNTKITAPAALRFAELFLEIIAAPDFGDEALEILKSKKNLRVIKMNKTPSQAYEYISVDGGLLAQQSDRQLLDKWEVVTKTAPDANDIPDLLFGLRAISFAKSNAIMVVKEQAATGIGGGQVNRIWAAKQALERSAAVMEATSQLTADCGGSPWKDYKPARVLISDAFFPFPDVIETAAKAGIKAILQPGGSVNDRLSIEACDKHGIAMVFTGTRHFKH